jgi:hypothetical protein
MKKTNSMRIGSNGSLEIDKNKVLEEISNNGKYQTENVLIKKWENDENADGFLTHFVKNNSSFIGILNDYFQRDGYGINILENGDKYFGNFEKDKRSKHGLYFFEPEEKDDKIYKECYFGFWKDNLKDKNGIYMWLEEPKENITYDNTNFDVYVGQIENDGFKKGTYLSKIGEDYYLYHGNFDYEGRKTDDDAYIYSSKHDRLLHGRIYEDVFIEGYIAFFDPNTGLIIDLAHSTFDKDGNMKDITCKEDIEKDKVDKEEKIMTLFRNVILGEDYFGQLYQKVKDITKFVDENLGDVKVFNDNDKFPIMIKLAVAYARDNINIDISEKVFQE